MEGIYFLCVLTRVSRLVMNAAVLQTVDISFVCKLFLNSAFDIKRECAFFLRNLSRYGSPQLAPTAAAASAAASVLGAGGKPKRYLHVLIDQHKILPGIVSLLKVVDQDLVYVGLHLLEDVLSLHPKGPKLVEEAGALLCCELVRGFIYRHTCVLW